MPSASLLGLEIAVSNALAVSLRSDIHAAPPLDVSSASLAAAHRAEDERHLGNLDGLTNWLCGECNRVASIESDYLTRWPDMTPMRVSEASIPELLHLLVTEQDPATLVLVRDRLAQRWLEESRA